MTRSPRVRAAPKSLSANSTNGNDTMTPLDRTLLILGSVLLSLTGIAATVVGMLIMAGEL